MSLQWRISLEERTNYSTMRLPPLRSAKSICAAPSRPLPGRLGRWLATPHPAQSSTEVRIWQQGWANFLWQRYGWIRISLLFFADLDSRNWENFPPLKVTRSIDGFATASLPRPIHSSGWTSCLAGYRNPCYRSFRKKYRWYSAACWSLSVTVSCLIRP